MIKNKSEIEARGIEIDLTGPQGNAFYLLGMVAKLAPKLGLEVSVIQNEMKEGDYDSLVDVFEKYFGKYVTLYR